MTSVRQKSPPAFSHRDSSLLGVVPVKRDAVLRWGYHDWSDVLESFLVIRYVTACATVENVLTVCLFEFRLLLLL